MAVFNNPVLKNKRVPSEKLERVIYKSFEIKIGNLKTELKSEFSKKSDYFIEERDISRVLDILVRTLEKPFLESELVKLASKVLEASTKFSLPNPLWIVEGIDYLRPLEYSSIYSLIEKRAEIFSLKKGIIRPVFYMILSEHFKSKTKRKNNFHEIEKLHDLIKKIGAYEIETSEQMKAFIAVSERLNNIKDVGIPETSNYDLWNFDFMNFDFVPERKKYELRKMAIRLSLLGAGWVFESYETARVAVLLLNTLNF